MLHQPRRGNLVLSIEGGINRNLKPPRRSSAVQVVVLVVGDHWIFEKRSGAVRILISRRNEHCFTRANAPNSLSGLAQSWSRRAATKVIFQIGILNSRLSPWLKRVRNTQNYEAPALTRIENARAVIESASFLA